METPNGKIVSEITINRDLMKKSRTDVFKYALKMFETECRDYFEMR